MDYQKISKEEFFNIFSSREIPSLWAELPIGDKVVKVKMKLLNVKETKLSLTTAQKLTIADYKGIEDVPASKASEQDCYLRNLSTATIFYALIDEKTGQRVFDKIEDIDKYLLPTDVNYLTDQYHWFAQSLNPMQDLVSQEEFDNFIEELAKDIPESFLSVSLLKKVACQKPLIKYMASTLIQQKSTINSLLSPAPSSVPEEILSQD